MTTLCVTPIKGLVYRLVHLDACGVPVTGSGSVVVSKFAKVTPAFEYEDGQEFLVKAADGSACVNEKDDSFLKRVVTTVDLCNIDPDGLVIVTGETLITAGSPVTGTGVAFGEALNTNRFSLEVWQKVAGSSACDAAGNQQYLYWAFFNMGGAKITGYSIENAPSTLAYSAESRAGATAWLTEMAPLTTGLPSGFSPGGKHYAFNVTTVAPPTPTCGATALT